MTGAMYAAIGGLKSHMSNLNVIGNNIANVNTVGYKAQRMTFQESIYTMSRAGSDGGVTAGGNNPSQIGYGASVGSIDLNMAPSTYAPTGYGLDCMMMGEGFFLVGDKDISVNSAADLKGFNLTRVGDFWKDPKGFICDRGGQVAYGFTTVYNPFKNTNATQGAAWMGFDNETMTKVTGAEMDTIVSTQLGPLRVPVGAAAPTKENGGLTEDGVAKWDKDDPVYDLMGPVRQDEDGNLYRSTVSIGDIVREAVTAVDTENKDATTQPDGVTFVAGDATATPPTTDCWYYTGHTGCRVAMDQNKNILSIEFMDGTGIPSGGLTTDAQNPDAGYKLAEGPYDNDAFTEAAEAANPGAGGAAGDPNPNYWKYDGPIPNSEALPIEPSSMSVSKEGGIICQDSNGNTVVMGYLAVGSCASNDGVTHIGGCYYKAQEGAGDMRVAALGGVLKGRYLNNKLNIGLNGASKQPSAADGILAGGTNEIKNAGLEASGTDVATEFSNMIVTQRGYQANTRIVTVTDSMLEELVNMKR